MNTFSYYFPLLLIVFTLGPTSATAQGQDIYKVVINHEEQYSVWPANKTAPKGWQDTEVRGNQDRCQDYIAEVWTDMRPLSVRKMNLPDDTEYSVVVNHEEQYSIWPQKLALPKGWKRSKVEGSLSSCRRHIEEVWTDMRPLSVRKR